MRSFRQIFKQNQPGDAAVPDQQPPQSLGRFEYSPLPGRTHIRLLRFLGPVPKPGRSADVEVELSTHPLGEETAFQCLSYAWGNPTFAHSKSAEEVAHAYEHEYDISVNGAAFPVKKNLHDALKMLRTREAGRHRARLYWIDAICIDQGNLREKGEQVAMMDKIYSTAEETIAWAGPQDEFTEDAVSLIQSLGSIPRNRHRPLSLADWNGDQEKVLGRMGAKPRRRFGTVATLKWMDLLAFFNRPYFGRIWVVQEIVLSRSVVLVCGKHELAWDLLSNTLAFLLTSGWVEHIRVQFFRGYPNIMASATKYRRLLEQRNLGIGIPVVNLEQTRTGIRQVHHLALFRYLLEAYREADATRPEDKIYALLGLAWKDRPPFSTHPGVLTPDYSLNPEDVYIKTARLMLLSHGDLRYLCHVEDRSLRKLKGLPSWVPDYSVPLRPLPYYLLSSTKFDASKGLACFRCEDDMFSRDLRVSGFRLSPIVATARFYYPEDETENERYVAEAMQAIAAFVAGISDAQLLLMKPGMRRSEVFWRTFCGDSSARQSPAPDMFGSHFILWLVVLLTSCTFSGNKFSRSELDHALGGGRWRERFPWVEKLLWDDPTAQCQIDHTFDDLFEPLELTQLKYAIQQFSSAYLDWHCTARGHFSSEDGIYGIGPLSMESGDEVWILAGEPVPCVLRPASGGRFELLGEAYIHGIMKGELADHRLLQETQELVLV